ncbi:MAG: family 16 glycoside hydrolase [Planctomycetota bacterium]
MITSTRSEPNYVLATVLALLIFMTILLSALIVAWFPARPASASRAAAVAALPVTSGSAPLAETALRLTRAPSLATPPPAAAAPVPRWIWSTAEAAQGQAAWFRRHVETADVRRAVLRFTADNDAAATVNGSEVGRGDDWSKPVEVDLTAAAETGALEILIAASNDGGPAGLLAVLELEEASGARRWVVTDDRWETADDAGFAAPRPAVDLGPHGSGPWGTLAGLQGGDLDRSIAVLEGFDVELVYTVPRAEGSWVCLAVDDRGRLIASDQSNGLYRLTPGESARDTRVERLGPEPGGAQGLLCMGDDLYVVVNVGGSEGPGLYRLRDTDGDDAYDDLALLRAIPKGTGEHGAHAILLGPDGLLYVAGGNHTPLPVIERSAVPRVWDEDHLLPRLWDARGHAVGVMAPGGWICRTDLDGREWELLSIGYRNAYDMAFTAEGDLLAYDADMEWDMGAPWYRPTRVCHATSGSEFGWRSGTGKWPVHYPDSLPPVIDIGPGSPTGVVTGDGSSFPPRYREAMFLLDWTFGTIYAMHLIPDGSTYRAETEMFLTGRPLPLTDAVINPVDGAMYFAVGGRGVASAVYRVRWVGSATPPPPMAAGDPGAADARARRRALEALHRADAPASAISTIWPALGDDDRFVRYAARVALEHQPVERWGDRAVAETDARTALAALLALARTGGPAWRDPLTAALRRLAPEALTPEHRRELLRVWALRFIRGGPPEDALARALLDELEPLYPSGEDALDRELCDMLVYLGSARVVAATIPLMERPDQGGEVELDEELLSRSDAYGQVILQMASARPQQQQVHYALSLRNATRGWTGPLRRRYFRWFDTARRTQGGLSFAGFLDAIRADALANVPEAQRERYAELGRYDRPDPDPATRPRGPGRSWTVTDILELTEGGLSHRSAERGAQLFRGATCAQCHRLGDTGLAGGPDLTGVATRFSVGDIVEAIVEPSRTVSDQYAQTELELDDGRVLLGRIVHEDEAVVRLLPSLLEPQATVDVDPATIVERRVSAVSPMMPLLLDSMAPGEVLDLLAYMLSGGDPRSPLFEPSGAGPWRELFDGRTLAGWSGDMSHWSVEDGAIVGRATAGSPLARNIFLVLDEPLPRDFELRAEVRLAGSNNSGIQYRSVVRPDGGVGGYQCDIHPNPDYDGMVYEEGGRGILAEHGQRMRLSGRGRRVLLDEPAEPVVFDRDEWHEYSIIAVGERLEHRIDGTVTTVLVDEQGSPASGERLALQLHAGAPYEVRIRSVRVRSLGLPPQASSNATVAPSSRAR